MDTLLFNKYLDKIKNNTDWVKVILCSIILILVFFLVRRCQKPELITNTDKALIEKLQKEAKQHENIAKAYKDSVKVLKEKKVVIKKEIEHSISTTKEKLEPIPTLTTKGIAVFFQTTYKVPVVITQYGVALPDTLAKNVITDLIKGQGYKEELDLTKVLLKTEEKENVAKDTIIVNLDKALTKKDSIDAIKDVVLKHAEQSIKVERNKKTLWQVISGVAVGVITFLVINN